MKKCSRCRSLKLIDGFSKKSASADGLKSHCKECEKIDRAKNFSRDKLLKAKWVKENKARHVSTCKQYNLQHKDTMAPAKRLYRREYEFNRLKNNIQHKLRNRLRARLHASFISTGDTQQFLGCSLEEFKNYIESKWQPGMTWDNWSKYGWHIDHIKPLKSFDLTIESQLREACLYTNLQPLWAEDNLKKSSKV